MALILVCIFNSIWFSLTCLINFLIVPNLFRNIESVETAGSLGILFFTTFNKLEIALGIGGLILISLRKKLIPVIGQGLLLFLAIIYLFYLSPLIAVHGMAAQEGNSNSIGIFANAHQLYATLDTIKLFILLGLTVFYIIGLKKYLNEYQMRES